MRDMVQSSAMSRGYLRPMPRIGSLVLSVWMLASCAERAPGVADRLGEQMPLAPGGTRTLRELMGERATVFVTLDPECPFSQLYTTTLDSLSRHFAARGVAFVGLYPGGFVPAEAADRFAQEGHLGFPQVMDPDCRLALALQARVMPEAFVLDPAGHLFYRGAIDDVAVRPGRKRNQAMVHHLASALEGLLTDGGPRPEVKAVGCIVECGA